MRRRDFLVSTAAIAAVPLLPALATPLTSGSKVYFIGQDGFYVMSDGERPKIIEYSPFPGALWLVSDFNAVL